MLVVSGAPPDGRRLSRLATPSIPLPLSVSSVPFIPLAAAFFRQRRRASCNLIVTRSMTEKSQAAKPTTRWFDVS